MEVEVLAVSKKRILFSLVLFIFLGAVVNVAVAWGCMIVWPKIHTGNVVYYRGDELHPTAALYILESLLSNHEYARRDHTIVISDESRFGWIEYTANSLPGSKSTDKVLYVTVIEAGFPLKSLSCSYRTKNAGGLRSPREGFFHALELANWMRPPQGRLVMWYGFPLLPIWPGFAINTVFYASLSWLLILGPFTARRMIRRKRGLCLKCGYDLRKVEHEKCPECGAGVS